MKSVVKYLDKLAEFNQAASGEASAQDPTNEYLVPDIADDAIDRQFAGLNFAGSKGFSLETRRVPTRG